MVAFSLIPGNSRIKPCSLVRFLIIDCVLSGMTTGTWSNGLAVNDINIPSQFVILGVVNCIAKKETAIKGRLFVEGIYRLDGCVKSMSCIDSTVLRSCSQIQFREAEIRASFRGKS